MDDLELELERDAKRVIAAKRRHAWWCWIGLGVCAVLYVACSAIGLSKRLLLNHEGAQSSPVLSLFSRAASGVEQLVGPMFWNVVPPAPNLADVDLFWLVDPFVWLFCGLLGAGVWFRLKATRGYAAADNTERQFPVMVMQAQLNQNNQTNQPITIGDHNVITATNINQVKRNLSPRLEGSLSTGPEAGWLYGAIGAIGYGILGNVATKLLFGD